MHIICLWSKLTLHKMIYQLSSSPVFFHSIWSTVCISTEHSLSSTKKSRSNILIIIIDGVSNLKNINLLNTNLPFSFLGQKIIFACVVLDYIKSTNVVVYSLSRRGYEFVESVYALNKLWVIRWLMKYYKWVHYVRPLIFYIFYFSLATLGIV